MNRWHVLARKEGLEMVRSYKLLWVPLVFLMLGISQPLVMKYLPDILSWSGSLPPGLDMAFPELQPGAIMAQILNQFGTVGLLVLVLSLMSTVSGEIHAGTAGAVLVRPVSYGAFVASKCLAAAALTLVSFLFGYGAGWYYTEMLFGNVPAAEGVAAGACYGLWMLFAANVTLLMSSWLRSGAASAALTLGLVLLLSLAQSWRIPGARYLPSALSANAAALLMPDARTEPISGAIAVAIVLSAACAVLAVILLETRNSILPDGR
ncbi:ABC transporter permease [Paenibacillus dendritiformis]|uniref:ABC transporter permease n=1 Tax=Paenibacillus dendritiformis TaxID=130049 RepID=UPI00143D807B|nr:ABC transporter permease subunit [Paenibacillus dendritiformis]NKI20522.1 ABC transporter permease [Paenibacillus dendritiformis]NRG00056.1 ABC transporter permease [Paenibacillus dendritiformis]